MRCLLTGASGFLGRYIAELLVARGDQVRAWIRRPDSDLSNLGVDVRLGDLREDAPPEDLLEGIEAIIHTAALAGIWGPWRTYYQVNVLGTERLLAAAKRAGVPRFVYTSSPSVTFEGGEQLGIDEQAPYARRFLCHYPRSKALAEELVLNANNRQGLRTCALRPHLIWGPRDRSLIPRLLDRAGSGRLRRVGKGDNKIDTIYVENAAAAHLRAIDALSPDGPAGGQAYFLSQGEPVECWPWIDEILRLAGLPPVKKSISVRAAYGLGAVLEAAYWATGRHSEPPMTRFLAAQLGHSHYFSIERAKRELGFEPRISMAEGMSRLAESLKGRHGENP